MYVDVAKVDALENVVIGWYPVYTQGTTKVHWMPITTRFFVLFSNEEIYYCLDSVDSQVKWNLLLKINVPEFISLEMGDDRNES